MTNQWLWECWECRAMGQPESAVMSVVLHQWGRPDAMLQLAGWLELLKALWAPAWPLWVTTGPVGICGNAGGLLKDSASQLPKLQKRPTGPTFRRFVATIEGQPFNHLSNNRLHSKALPQYVKEVSAAHNHGIFKVGKILAWAGRKKEKGQLLHLFTTDISLVFVYYRNS